MTNRLFFQFSPGKGSALHIKARRKNNNLERRDGKHWSVSSALPIIKSQTKGGETLAVPTRALMLKQNKGHTAHIKVESTSAQQLQRSSERRTETVAKVTFLG